jgi:RHS repeat-associated protein
VLVVISDKKLKTCTGDTVNYYTADVVQATDYSAFGVILKGREYYADTTGKYRMGFNGKENDNEVSGGGNWQEYGMRMYSPRLGRFPNVDPLSRNYPMLSPYPFAANSPIIGVDLDGLELQPTNSSMYRLKFVKDYGLVPINATEVKRLTLTQVVIVHKNVPRDYKFGNLKGVYVGTDGKDGVYPNGVIDATGKIILFADDGSPSTYPTVKSSGKGRNRFTYVGQNESVRGNGFGSMVGAAEMARDAIGFVSVYNELLANGDEVKDRMFFYRATNIVDKYIQDGFFGAADERFRTGAGRVDIINYINDGTLPQILATGTKEQIEQSKAYQKLVISYGNEIMRREGIPYTDPSKGVEPVPLSIPAGNQ